MGFAAVEVGEVSRLFRSRRGWLIRFISKHIWNSSGNIKKALTEKDVDRFSWDEVVQQSQEQITNGVMNMVRAFKNLPNKSVKKRGEK